MTPRPDHEEHSMICPLNGETIFLADSCADCGGCIEADRDRERKDEEWQYRIN